MTMRRLLKTTTGDPVTDSNLDRLYRLATRLGQDHGKPLIDWVHQIEVLSSMLPGALRSRLATVNGAGAKVAATPIEQTDHLWSQLSAALIRELDHLFDAYESGSPPLDAKAAIETRPRTLGEAIFDQTKVLLIAEKGTPRFKDAVAAIRRMTPVELHKDLARLDALSGSDAAAEAAPVIGRLRQVAYEMHHRPATAE